MSDRIQSAMTALVMCIMVGGFAISIYFNACKRIQMELPPQSAVPNVYNDARKMRYKDTICYGCHKDRPYAWQYWRDRWPRH